MTHLPATPAANWARVSLQRRGAAPWRARMALWASSAACTSGQPPTPLVDAGVVPAGAVVEPEGAVPAEAVLVGTVVDGGVVGAALGAGVMMTPAGKAGLG